MRSVARSGPGCHEGCGVLLFVKNEKLYDEDFVEKWTHGFNQLKERVQEFPPAACEKHCQTEVIRFGTIEDLSNEMLKNAKTVLWTLR